MPQSKRNRAFANLEAAGKAEKLFDIWRRKKGIVYKTGSQYSYLWLHKELIPLRPANDELKSFLIGKQFVKNDDPDLEDIVHQVAHKAFEDHRVQAVKVPESVNNMAAQNRFIVRAFVHGVVLGDRCCSVKSGRRQNTARQSTKKSQIKVPAEVVFSTDEPACGGNQK